MAALPGALFVLLALALGKKRGREEGRAETQPGVPPQAFPPPGAKTFETITATTPVTPGGRRAGPAAAPGIQAEIGPLEPAGMQKGIPGVKRGAFPGWHAAKRPTPYMVQRANAIMRDPSVPVGANITEGDTQYRKRRDGGKLYTYVFVR